jgi:replication factor C subunit 1
VFLFSVFLCVLFKISPILYFFQLNSSVSGKTDFLVAGSVLDDGRPVSESNKYKTAVDKNIPILTEAEFIAKCRSHPASAPAPTIPLSTATPAVVKAETKASTATTAIASSSTYAPKPSSSSSSSNGTSAGARTGSSASYSASASASASSVPRVEDRLWVDKYKPKSINDVIGSQDIARR